MKLKQLVTKYILWRKEKNENTQYDDIHEFFNEMSKKDLILIM